VPGLDAKIMVSGCLMVAITLSTPSNAALSLTRYWRPPLISLGTDRQHECVRAVPSTCLSPRQLRANREPKRCPHLARSRGCATVDSIHRIKPLPKLTAGRPSNASDEGEGVSGATFRTPPRPSTLTRHRTKTRTASMARQDLVQPVTSRDAGLPPAQRLPHSPSRPCAC
jgi:hypothetical protein